MFQFMNAILQTAPDCLFSNSVIPSFSFGRPCMNVLETLSDFPLY
jgi:hypothetical protein